MDVRPTNGMVLGGVGHGGRRLFLNSVPIFSSRQSDLERERGEAQRCGGESGSIREEFVACDSKVRTERDCREGDRHVCD